MPEAIKIAGVIGAGSFGSAVAQLLAYNSDVLLFTRHTYTAEKINAGELHHNIKLNPRIKATTDPIEICDHCSIIFPIIPSVNFRTVIKMFSPYLDPSHLLIHGTKGFDIGQLSEDQLMSKTHSQLEVYTMSEVIQQETSVLRIGCLAGPNLSKEILDGQPTATVIASNFDEVIQVGQRLLSSRQFFVFGSHDLKGAEIAGSLKNMVALGAGMLAGMGLGKNIQSMLITKGLAEMIYFGKAMGASVKSFLGTAGIGDLIATATSDDSRNYSVGKRLAQGENLQDILESSTEVAEGLRTLRILYPLMTYHKILAPITAILYKVVFEKYDLQKGINYLMNYPYKVDVDFLDMPDTD